ncbi:MAG: hypothetical protein JST30_00775 [Armatimonadetes bacterium]|nr:hypothetical protein [Armatimonadota bacterium]
MRLKVLTTGFLVTGIVLMLCWPIVVGAKPPVDAGRPRLVQWGRRAILYFGVTAGVWVGTAFSALLLARQTRKEFLLSEKANLTGLVEGALRDHER